jgi:hypothetical protein
MAGGEEKLMSPHTRSAVGGKQKDRQEPKLGIFGWSMASW